MKLYHASKHQFDVIKRQQATHIDPEAFAVPESELQNKIYLTPDFGFAVAMAAGPDGMTSLVDGKISFEHAEKFDGDCPVYVYEVDSMNIPSELVEKVDDEQVAVDLDEIVPNHVRVLPAKNVFNYYERTNWQHPSESN